MAFKCEDNDYKTASKRAPKEVLFICVFFCNSGASLSTIKESYTIRYLICLANRFESESRRAIKRASCPLIELFRVRKLELSRSFGSPGDYHGGEFTTRALITGDGVGGEIHLRGGIGLWRRYRVPLGGISLYRGSDKETISRAKSGTEKLFLERKKRVKM